MEQTGTDDEFAPAVALFTENNPKSEASEMVQKNYDDFSNIILASVRYGIWLRSQL